MTEDKLDVGHVESLNYIANVSDIGGKTGNRRSKKRNGGKGHNGTADGDEMTDWKTSENDPTGAENNDAHIDFCA